MVRVVGCVSGVCRHGEPLDPLAGTPIAPNRPSNRCKEPIVSSQSIQPQPGRRPVYPVDSEEQAGSRAEQPVQPQIPPPGSKDDPASDEKTEPANHPNDE
jgi:hypothetical protein